MQGNEDKQSAWQVIRMRMRMRMRIRVLRRLSQSI